tara:strand:+ start:48 stop:548 length:501 start_codon:yes stop_codon:yes gene_type:complete
MAGGGTAPAMKMSDVFILLGVTFLLGGLFIHGLVSPIGVSADTEAYTNGASLLKGDTIQITVDVENDSSFMVEIRDDAGSVVISESFNAASGDSTQINFEAEQKGFYTYSITFSQGEGEVLVDVDRQLLFDFIIYPLGIICLVFGIAKRRDEQSKETLDAVLVSSD